MVFQALKYLNNLVLFGFECFYYDSFQGVLIQPRKPSESAFTICLTIGSYSAGASVMVGAGVGRCGVSA